MNHHEIKHIAQMIQQADSLIITAGAGMGIDSGLPDFRGKNGFWKAFPPLAHLGKSFVQMATPDLFATNPKLAWGFYGWRLKAYREVIPHHGFSILKQWAEQKKHGAFIFTSNVDGQFQKAGFSETQIIECHGSIHHLQCTQPCCQNIWAADDFVPQVNENTCELENEPPVCPHCGALARPNILMFGDGKWLPYRANHQENIFQNQFVTQISNPVIIELGAGTAIPSVRLFSERMSATWHAPLIRINPDETTVSSRLEMPVKLGALNALTQIQAA